MSRHFKSAKDDIGAAGNCYAADLHTAAVFHLMRVAEKGMKALARHLGIKKVTKTKPLTLALGRTSSRQSRTSSTRYLPLTKSQTGRAIRGFGALKFACRV